MITFELGHVPMKNATVVLGKDLKDPNATHDAFAERQATGDIHITIDVIEPPTNEPVHLVLHKENNSRFNGTIVHKEGKLVFKNRNEP